MQLVGLRLGCKVVGNSLVCLPVLWPDIFMLPDKVCACVCVCVRVLWSVQILSPLGRISEALGDLTKAIQLQPSARLYRHRGTLLFISEVGGVFVYVLLTMQCQEEV